MKCPFRLGVKYNYITVGENAVMVGNQNEEYADCYGEECPLYEETFTGDPSCKRLNILLDEEE